MSGLTNKYLEHITKRIIKHDFLGVYPSDVSPRTNKEEFSVIFNLSEHDERGSHFIAIIKKKKKIMYFDSFGEKCYIASIQKFMDRFLLPIIWNNKKIQNNFSNFCGFYCFYFLIHCFHNNHTLNHFIKQFQFEDLKENDLLLINFIVKKIRKIKQNI